MSVGKPASFRPVAPVLRRLSASSHHGAGGQGHCSFPIGRAVMADLTPTEWFDQFPQLQEVAEWPADSQWCPRHWAPCPLLHANGIGATTEIFQVWLNEFVPKGSFSPEAMNRKLAAAGHICCLLGDERMYELWGHWSPTRQPEPGNG